MQWRYRIEDATRAIREFFEDQWFDRTRNVHTSGNVSLRSAGIASEHTADSELYVPARPRHIREALQATGVREFSEYSYVDLGSGKGRTLFIAAERGFRQITGVEFSPRLHEQACANVRRFRSSKRRRTSIESVLMNAKDFMFPEGKMVLYLFNPFGAETMQVVLDHLGESLRREPRHVVIVLLWPRCGEQVARLDGMRLRTTTAHHQIFEYGGQAFAAR